MLFGVHGGDVTRPERCRRPRHVLPPAAADLRVTSITWPSTPLTKAGDSSMDSSWPAPPPSSTATGSGTSSACRQFLTAPRSTARSTAAAAPGSSLQVRGDQPRRCAAACSGDPGHRHRCTGSARYVGRSGLAQRVAGVDGLRRGHAPGLGAREQVHCALAGLMPTPMCLAVRHRQGSRGRRSRQALIKPGIRPQVAAVAGIHGLVAGVDGRALISARSPGSPLASGCAGAVACRPGSVW